MNKTKLSKKIIKMLCKLGIHEYLPTMAHDSSPNRKCKHCLKGK